MKIFFPLIATFFLFSYLPASGSQAAAPRSNSTRLVLASDYCDFLNYEASTSSKASWNEKMGLDSRAASIARVGTCGSYEYFVIAGRENNPITFVNEDDAASYSSWAAVKEVLSDLDPSIASNESFFSVAYPVIETLSLETDNVSKGSSWTTGDTVITGLIGVGVVWALGEPLCRTVKPYEEHNFQNDINNQRIREIRVKKFETQSEATLSNSSSISAMTEEERNAADAKKIVQLNRINRFLDVEKTETSTSENSNDQSIDSKEKSSLKALSWRGPSIFRRMAERLQRQWKKFRNESSEQLNEATVVPQSIEESLHNGSFFRDQFCILKNLKNILEGDHDWESARPLTAYEEGELDWTLETASLRLYQIQKLDDYNQAILGADASEKQQLESDFCASFKRAQDIIEKRDDLFKKMKQRRENIRQRLNFLNNNKERESIDRQHWTILSAQKNGKIQAVRCLEKILNNHVDRLKCAHLLAAPEKTGNVAEGDKTKETYELWQKDLQANPGLGLTRLDYLHYAWEQQGLFFSFRDPYNIAPWYVRGMGATRAVTQFVLGSFMHTTLSTCLWGAAWLATLAKAFGW